MHFMMSAYTTIECFRRPKTYANIQCASSVLHVKCVSETACTFQHCQKEWHSCNTLSIQLFHPTTVMAEQQF